jgi:hypothetical protein
MRPMGRHHGSPTDGGARSQVGQLDYDLSSTSPATVCIVYKGVSLKLVILIVVLISVHID